MTQREKKKRLAAVNNKEAARRRREETKARLERANRSGNHPKHLLLELTRFTECCSAALVACGGQACVAAGRSSVHAVAVAPPRWGGCPSPFAPAKFWFDGAQVLVPLLPICWGGAGGGRRRSSRSVPNVSDGFKLSRPGSARTAGAESCTARAMLPVRRRRVPGAFLQRQELAR